MKTPNMTNGVSLYRRFSIAFEREKADGVYFACDVSHLKLIECANSEYKGYMECEKDGKTLASKTLYYWTKAPNVYRAEEALASSPGPKIQYLIIMSKQTHDKVFQPPPSVPVQSTDPTKKT